MFEVKNLSYTYNSGRGVSNINIKIKEGNVLALLGNNGSGKTTIFKLISKILEQASGNLSINKKDINSNDVGYVSEERTLIKDVKVIDQLKYIGRLRGVNEIDLDIRINSWLDYLDVAKYKNDKIYQLSKGNQQKIQIMCSLLHEPKLLILDEPLNGLDIDNINILKKIINKFKEENKYVIISSHQYYNIEDLCDDIIYIKNGNIVLSGNIMKLKHRYKERKVYLVNDDYEYWNKQKGVIDITYSNNKIYLIIKDEKHSKDIVKMICKKDIKEYSLGYLSLVDIMERFNNEEFNSI